MGFKLKKNLILNNLLLLRLYKTEAIASSYCKNFNLNNNNNKINE